MAKSYPHLSEPTERERAKAERRESLLREATRLFALHGYAGVSLEDLGAACGISGPAVYRHFSGKQAVLIALMVDMSKDILDGGQKAVGSGGEPLEVLGRLVDFHTDFSLSRPDIIQVQDRDLKSLPKNELQLVRKLQNSYIGLWTDQLGKLHPNATSQINRFRAHAVFGLLNSTSHSVHNPRTKKSGLKALLSQMALAALTSPVG
ncbi:TetR family transcriptional regulator [Glutamicibacter creatinolyticus]|uniref:TetR family transcriptional regulator n=1 Tax=Glutamicibacter creatinolyticus TaxID=162496 RepID=A0A5B7WQZ1_9MICC|nr:TetR family transcriptional regulator [Glutamicibacter creatinolyticus]QCY46546.1 TetR family transcriptional regulator [Glutamicibacter creatinolyticus]